MARAKIDAYRVTKPIQLLAAWLIGLMLVNGSFLASAISIGNGWERSILVVAAILNVPGFLFAIFLLQTKFRPELQEDIFYSEYINKKTSASFELSKIDILERKILDLQIKIDDQHLSITHLSGGGDQANLDWSKWKVGLNSKLPFYADLKKALNDANIPIESTFGSPASELVEYTVVFSNEITSEYIIYLLKIIIKFPFDGFAFWEPIREIGENEDIYIGNYGTQNNIIRLNEKSRAAIVKAKDRADLLKLGE